MPLEFVDEGLGLDPESERDSDKSLDGSTLASGNQSTAASIPDSDIDPSTNWSGYVKSVVPEDLLASGAEVRSGLHFFPANLSAHLKKQKSTESGTCTTDTGSVPEEADVESDDEWLEKEHDWAWICIGAPGSQVEALGAQRQGTFIRVLPNTAPATDVSTATGATIQGQLTTLLGRPLCWDYESLAQLEQRVTRLAMAYSMLSGAPTTFHDPDLCRQVGSALVRSSDDDDGEWKVDVGSLITGGGMYSDVDKKYLMTASETREAFCQLDGALFSLRTDAQRLASQGLVQSRFLNVKKFATGAVLTDAARSATDRSGHSLEDEGYGSETRV